MLIFSNSKKNFTAGLLFLLFACNPGASKDKGATNDKPAKDNLVTTPPSPATTPPATEIASVVKKCYANDGLNYKIFITVIYGSKNEVTGNVTSEELETGKKETTAFEGTFTGDKFTVKFKGTAPVVGTASEWTDKPWTIEQLPGKGQWMEKLHITFNAKNYNTNKWEDSDYQFAQVECK